MCWRGRRRNCRQPGACLLVAQHQHSNTTASQQHQQGSAAASDQDPRTASLQSSRLCRRRAFPASILAECARRPPSPLSPRVTAYESTRAVLSEARRRMHIRTQDVGQSSYRLAQAWFQPARALEKLRVSHVFTTTEPGRPSTPSSGYRGWRNKWRDTRVQQQRRTWRKL